MSAPGSRLFSRSSGRASDPDLDQFATGHPGWRRPVREEDERDDGEGAHADQEVGVAVGRREAAYLHALPQRDQPAWALLLQLQDPWLVVGGADVEQRGPVGE